MRFFWFFRIGQHGVLVGRGGCLGCLLLLVNVPVLLLLGVVAPLVWLRLHQFPLWMSLGAGAIILTEATITTLFLAGHAAGHASDPSYTGRRVDGILTEVRTRDERRRHAIFAHIHAIGEAARRRAGHR